MSVTATARRECGYCGLPVPPPWWGKPPANGELPCYCCYGCQFAASVAGAGGAKGEATWALTRLGLAVFFTLNVLVFTMTLWAQDVYPAADGEADLSHAFFGLFRYLSLLFTLPVLFLLGVPLLENALDCLCRGRPSTDFLLVLGVAAAYLYSVRSVVRGEGHVYFEVACVILVLVTLGRWVEAGARLRATEAIEGLQKLLPETVRRVGPGGEQVTPLAEVARCDVLRVLAGERVPVDGVALGPASVDEQLLTGESRPVAKEPGHPVYGGTLNLDGDLRLEAAGGSSDGVLARLLAVLAEARRHKGRYERLADRLSAWALLPVALVALTAFAGHAWASGLEQGILAGLAVSLIACPCALGIATPLAVWAALGEAARHQVLLRNGDVLERLALVRTVCLDKTGTLTTGRPTLAALVTADGDHREEVQRRAAALARSSGHAYSEAIARASDGTPELELTVQTHPGRGLSAVWPLTGEAVYLGSPRWMAEMACESPPDLMAARESALSEGRPLTCVGWGGHVQGVFLFNEKLRPEARAAVEGLRRLGVRVEVLTGDHRGRGAALEHELGVPVAAELLPADKLHALAKCRPAGGLVAMVGDGLNDAPALTGADVGIALGCGADVTRDSAAVCLLGDDLGRLPWLVDLARRAVRVIRQNLFWSFAYNVVGVGLACAGWLNPVWAAVAMTASSLMVTGNSLRLRGGYSGDERANA